MEYRVLGPLEVSGPTGRIGLEGRRERAVLTALALARGEVVSTERLLDAVWGDTPPRSAAKTVQNHVLRLRKVLGASAIETRERGYRLVVTPGDIDADQFEHLIRTARAKSVEGDHPAAIAGFQEARALWRGRPFPELEDCADADAEASRLSELERSAAEEMADAQLASGQDAEIVGELEALVTAEPLRERRWAMLMLAQYRAGRQADALRSYQRARTMLGEELGIEPGPELRALELAVATQDPTLDPPSRNGASGTAPRTGLVLMLSAELVGSAELLGRLGDDAAADLRRRTFVHLRDVAAEREGREVSASDDEMMVVFASAQQCLQAALEMGRRVHVDEAVHRTAAQLRIGVHAGEPVADDTDEVFGTPVTVARGLRAAAAPGQVLTSDLVRDLVGTRGGFVLDEVAPVVIPGVAERVPAVELVDPEREASASDETTRPPYKGLAPFEADDAELFFGRDLVVAELTARLRSSRFLAIVGASGSGKSSVLRAGLVASVQKGAFPGSGDWPIVVMTPTARPLQELARCWAPLAGTTAPSLLAALGEDLSSFAVAVRTALTRLRHGARFPLVIDQFEEVFTLCTDVDERRQFVAALVAGASADIAGATVVIALRADFYGHCAAYPELRQLVEANTCLLGPMDPPELMAAIEGPANVAGLRLEPGLNELIVREVADEPGALPLLSHALLETWKRRKRRTLTVDAYLDAGGVDGAIAATAEGVYEALDPAQQHIARSIFLRLTQPGDGTEDTRRRAPLTELVIGADAAETESVLHLLADARLVTLDEQTAEVAHEAVIREWPRLRNWIDEDRDGLRIHRHLTHAARDWDALERDDAELYRGPRLATAEEWLARDANAPLNDLESSFLAASAAKEDEEETGRVTRARAQARSNRRLRVLLTGTAIALVIALVAGVFAVVQRGNATREADTARAATKRATVDGILTASSSPGSESRYVRALLLLEAYRIQPSVRTRGAMFSALLDEPRLTATLPVTSAGPIWPAPDGKTVVMWTNGRLERWDVGRRRMIRRFPFRNFTAAAMSPTGTLAVSSADGVVHFVDLGGAPVARPIQLASTTIASSLTFSPEGTTVAVVSGPRSGVRSLGGPPRSGDRDVSVGLYDVATGARRDVPSTGHTSPVDAVAFSASGSRLVTGGADGILIVHDAATGEVVGAPIDVGSVVASLIADPVRPRVAVGSAATDLAVWDLDSGKKVGSLDAPTAAVGAYSPDGSRLAVNASNAVTLYDAATLVPTRDAPLATQSGVGWAAFAADHRVFVSGDSGPVTVWDPRRDAGRIERPVPGSPSYLFPMPGGRVVVEPDLGDAVTLLDARTLEPLGPPLSPGVAPRIVPEMPTTFAASYYDSHRIAVVNRAGVFQLFDVGTRAPIGQPIDLGFTTVYAVFSRDLRTVAVGGRGGQVAIVDVSGRSPRLLHRNLSTASSMNLYVSSLEFDPHGDLFAADQGHAFRFSRVRSSHPHVENLAPIADGGSPHGMGMDVSPDGRTVAVAHKGVVDFYDTTNLRPRGPSVPATNAPIGWLAYSRDGRYVVVNDTSNSVRLVDTAAHQAVGPPWKGLIYAGAVFNDDGRVIGTSTPTTGALMNLDPKVWRREACALAGRNLTAAEWQKYLPGQGPRRRTCPQYP